MAQATKRKAKESFFTDTFCSYSIDNVNEAKEFYGETLGIDTEEMQEGLQLNFDGTSVFLYPKDDHEASTYTVFNFVVEDIEAAVKELESRGIEFESFTGEMETDDQGIFRGKENGSGPNIAWFKDPAGNFLSVIEIEN